MFAPTVLPPQRPCFPAVLDKPPGPLLSKKILTDVGKIFAKTVMGPATEDKPPGADITVFGQSRAENVFTPRPLQLLVFCDRAAPHHSIILQIDGLIFACFRLRLERDVCAQSFDDSFCMSFGPGVSPASTFCGLYMPTPVLLRSVIQAVKIERGYGVFVGHVSCNAWSLLQEADNKQQKSALILFFFFRPGLLFLARCVGFVCLSSESKEKKA